MHTSLGNQLSPEVGYPDHSRARDQWIVSLRPERTPMDPLRPHGWILEQEPSENGELVSLATLFLTNRECPWRCVMCDLWKTTLRESIPAGAVLRQIDFGLEQLGVSLAKPSEPPMDLKLYNGGSFFDPRAIPRVDYPEIAQRAAHFRRVIVESHPAFVGEACLGFQQFLISSAKVPSTAKAPRLEVAMGLETAHPDILQKLNKRMTLNQFAEAADFLRHHGIALRVFVLVQPPFLPEIEALPWAERSIQFAFDCGATVVSLIPTRFGNGAMERLAQDGDFSPPRLATLESAHALGIGLRRGRVFGDLWDLEKFSQCHHCLPKRRERIHCMNLTQKVPAPVSCDVCGGGA